MKILALALAVLAGVGSEFRPPPTKLWSVAWHRQLVAPELLEWRPQERGGPAVDRATGYVVVGARDGWLHAFAPDGSLAWEFQTGGGFEAPSIIEAGVVYAGSGDGRLYALDLATGKERWRYDVKEDVGTTPAVAGGLVLAMTLQDTLFAVDKATGAWKWHHRRDLREGFTTQGAARVVVSGSVVVGAYSDGHVAVLELATGAVKWERRVVVGGDVLDVDGLEIDGGRVYLADYSGGVQALDLRTGEMVWHIKAPRACRLTLGSGLLLAVTTTELLGISSQDGSIRWKLPLNGGPAGAPVFAAGLALVPNTRGLLFIDPVSGRLLRVFDPGTGVSATVAVRGPRAYVLSNGGKLVAIDLS